MRFATFETADAAAGAGVVSDAGVHPLPAGVTVLALVRAGLEVAVVVGGNGGSLSPEQAREHIFGYTVMNDWSARDLDLDGFLALDMRALVNGEQVGQDLLSNMGWPFDELISYASRGTEVRAGDVVELTVEGIGTVRNRVVAGLTFPPVRGARDRSVPRRRKRG